MMVEKGIRGGICHATHRCAKANNKYMKNYNKNIEPSYLMYLYANNLHGWAMSDKKEYVVHIRALKQALNHGLTLKKVHRVNQFNQEAWLKPYIEMNNKLRTEEKKNLKKIFSN